MPLILPTAAEYERMAERHRRQALRRLQMESAEWRRLHLSDNPTIAAARNILDRLPRDAPEEIAFRQWVLDRAYGKTGRAM
jgi:hypothetical protein